MPIVTLKFNLPEEQQEYETTMKAGNFSHALWTFDTEFLRANIKHGIQERTVDRVIEELKYFLEEHGADKVSREDIARIAECTLEVARTELYEVMNSCEGNPFV